MSVVLQDPAIAALKAQLAAMQAGRQSTSAIVHACHQVRSIADMSVLLNATKLISTHLTMKRGNVANEPVMSSHA